MSRWTSIASCSACVSCLDGPRRASGPDVLELALLAAVHGDVDDDFPDGARDRAGRDRRGDLELHAPASAKTASISPLAPSCSAANAARALEYFVDRQRGHVVDFDRAGEPLAAPPPPGFRLHRLAVGSGAVEVCSYAANCWPMAAVAFTDSKGTRMGARSSAQDQCYDGLAGRMLRPLSSRTGARVDTGACSFVNNAPHPAASAIEHRQELPPPPPAPPRPAPPRGAPPTPGRPRRGRGGRGRPRRRGRRSVRTRPPGPSARAGKGPGAGPAPPRSGTWPRRGDRALRRENGREITRGGGAGRRARRVPSGEMAVPTGAGAASVGEGAASTLIVRRRPAREPRRAAREPCRAAREPCRPARVSVSREDERRVGRRGSRAGRPGGPCRPV